MSNETLRFPLDTTNDTKYQGTITFQPETPESFDLANVISSSTNIIPTNFANFVGGVAEAAQARVDQTIEQATSNVFSGASNARSTNVARGSGQKCKLYLPQAISIRDGVQYDNIDLGRIGEAIRRSVMQGDDIVQSVATAGIDGLKSAIGAVRTGDVLNEASGQAALAALADNLGNTISGAVRSGLQVTANPNTRAIFKSVPLRDFSFTFKMIPTSARESEMIKNIVYYFREQLYPEAIELEGTNGFSVGYFMPNVFNIEMAYKDQRVGTKILPAYLRNFTAQYNGSGMGFHSDGNFTEVDISMSFIEQETLHHRRIQEGY